MRTPTKEVGVAIFISDKDISARRKLAEIKRNFT